MVSRCLFCRSKAHPPSAESLQTRLWSGEGTPSLFPPPLHFSGPGAPPTTAGEVAQTFRSHYEEPPGKAKRGRLRNNEHLSNLSYASQSGYGQHEDLVLSQKGYCHKMARIARCGVVFLLTCIADNIFGETLGRLHNGFNIFLHQNPCNGGR